MIRTFKYRIYPNEEQQLLLNKNFGCVRFVYNLSLEKCINSHKETKAKFNKIQLINDIASLKKHPDFTWLKEVESSSLQQAIEDLGMSYQRFFRKLSQFPNFKKKLSKQSMRIINNNNNVRLNDDSKHIRLPKLGNVKIKYHRELVGEITSVTVTKNSSNQYFVCIRTKDEVEYTNPATPTKEESLGIDLGITHLAILSDGSKIANIKPLKSKLSKLKFLQKRASNKQKGSKNRKKANLAVAKLHQKITNVREDYLHRVTHTITKMDYTSFVLEDLAVSNMIKNHNLAQSIQDVSWNKFKTYLEYKAKRESKNVIYIGRFDASSKICNECSSTKKKLLLSEREWVCDSCGTVHDRDINAAKNIKDIYFSKYSPTEGGVELGEVSSIEELMNQEA
jgi:putative transposase